MLQSLVHLVLIPFPRLSRPSGVLQLALGGLDALLKHRRRVIGLLPRGRELIVTTIDFLIPIVYVSLKPLFTRLSLAPFLLARGPQPLHQHTQLLRLALFFGHATFPLVALSFRLLQLPGSALEFCSQPAYFRLELCLRDDRARLHVLQLRARTLQLGIQVLVRLGERYGRLQVLTLVLQLIDRDLALFQFLLHALLLFLFDL